MAQCEICGTEMTQGRGRARRTCSAACRQAAHRRRQAAEMNALRAAVAAPPAAAPSRDEPVVPEADDSPAGRIRSAGAALAAAVDHAAAAAEEGAYQDEPLEELQRRYADLVNAVRAAMPTREPSRNEPVPAARPRPRRTPTKRARLTERQALDLVENAQLVLQDRETHTYDVVAPDGTVIGHVEPAYRAGRRTGWLGWAAGMSSASAGQPHSNRTEAGAHAAGQWVRITTAPPRH